MNTFKSKSKQSRDTINWNLQIICWFFAVSKNRRNPFILAVFPEDPISNWTKFLFCSVNKLILSRPNYWPVRAFVSDLWCVALLRSFYSESIGMYRLLPVFPPYFLRISSVFPIGSYLQSTIQERLDMRLWIRLNWVGSEVRQCMIFVFLN